MPSLRNRERKKRCWNDEGGCVPFVPKEKKDTRKKAVISCIFNPEGGGKKATGGVVFFRGEMNLFPNFGERALVCQAHPERGPRRKSPSSRGKEVHVHICTNLEGCMR